MTGTPKAPATPEKSAPGTSAPEIATPETATPATPACASREPALAPAHRRPVRSFVTRAGRTTAAQARALAELAPRFVLRHDSGTTDLVAACAEAARAAGRSAPKVVLEIGFGMGQATAHIAELQPDTMFIGCEVHEPGVGALLKLLGERGLANVRIVQHDAVEVLRHMVAPGTLHGLHVFFPDPWHKKRHHKRRLVQPAFTRLAASRLAPGGTLHLATDWQPYAEQMLAVLSAEPLLVNTAGGFAERPVYRPETKFERRGLRLGHGVWDLVFRRTDAPCPPDAAPTDAARADGKAADFAPAAAAFHAGTAVAAQPREVPGAI